MATSTSKLLHLPRKGFPLVAQYLILSSCIFLIISIHPKRYQTLFQECVTKAFSWKTYNIMLKSPPYERQAQTYDIKSPYHGRQYHLYLTKNKRNIITGNFI